MATSTGRSSDIEEFRTGPLAIRSFIGGLFMGLANLVPGISGGTMLLAVGVYPQFIGGVAEVSTLRFRPKVLLMLVCVVGAAGIAIGGFAQLISMLLDRQQWAMYCLFIGLTIGGVPLLWRMLQPVDGAVLGCAGVAISIMALLAVIDPDRIGSTGAPNLAAYAMLIVAGFSGGAAMILPGVSGAYLLLLLGQYRTIVDAVAAGADGLRGGDWSGAGDALHVLVPVAVGVAIGVVGVSNLVQGLLARHERATLGCLLGLLLGAVIGLWPFTEPVAPAVGDVIRGTVLTTQELVAAVDPEDYRRFAVTPTGGQTASGAALILCGFGISWTISRLGK